MLRPAYLVAAAITEDRVVELPAGDGAAFLLARALFRPDGAGGFVQRVVSAAGQASEWHPLDMAFFSRCLALSLGPATPDLFAVRGVAGAGQSCGRLVRTDAAASAARLRALEDAFQSHRAASRPLHA